jgi:hypothetical protein
MEKLVMRSRISDFITVLIALPLPVVAGWVYLASYLLLDQLEAHFPCSKFLKVNERLHRRLGMPGKVMRCGAVFLVFLFPRWSVSRGDAIDSEILSVPRSLKLKLCYPFSALFLWAIALFIWGAVYL